MQHCMFSIENLPCRFKSGNSQIYSEVHSRYAEANLLDRCRGILFLPWQAFLRVVSRITTPAQARLRVPSAQVAMARGEILRTR